MRLLAKPCGSAQPAYRRRKIRWRCSLSLALFGGAPSSRNPLFHQTPLPGAQDFSATRLAENPLSTSGAIFKDLLRVAMGLTTGSGQTPGSLQPFGGYPPSS